MVQKVSAVPFTLDNVKNCRCPACPVQAASTCVEDRKKGLGQALKATPLKREDIPGVYCATGTATCSGLDPKKSCICGTCRVFSQYKLALGQPAGYYCRDGAASR